MFSHTHFTAEIGFRKPSAIICVMFSNMPMGYGWNSVYTNMLTKNAG